MGSSTKIFLYSGKHSSSQSVADSKSLLQQAFPKADVVETIFQSNYEGLTNSNHPLFCVVGAESSNYLAKEVQPRIEQIQTQLGKDKVEFNYMGICGGAYIATADATIYQCSYDTTTDCCSNKFQAPELLYSFKTTNIPTLGLSDYQSIGPFYPNDSYTDSNESLYFKTVPYRTSVSLGKDKRSFLYVAGCTFTPPADTKSQCEVVATYADQSEYKFACNGEITKLKKAPAILRSYSGSDEKSKGNFLLSGVHIEATVKNSRMLGFFKSGLASVQLPKKDQATLDKESEASCTKVTNLLQDTFKFGK